jgi:hypothetical protein
MRIALFTPFSPEVGGGAVQLRSHLSQMNLDVDWYYLAAAPVAGERRFYLGKPFSHSQFVSDLSARTGFLPGSTQPVKEIASKIQADLYWVVGHYEGISVADELLSIGKPVHLTVHDEPLAMLIVSRRLRMFWPLMRRTFSKVLRAAKSVDVTSTNMRDYFIEKYERDCFALYLHVPKLPDLTSHLSEDTLTVGHIGKLYHPAPFRKFILACREYAHRQKKNFKMIRIGRCTEMDKVAAENVVKFESYGELAEMDALPVLAGCHFLYAMYPAGFRFQAFRRTSLPIKLSTYIQSQRPIFAHTPPDSGLAQLVSKHGVGSLCSSNQESELLDKIHAVLNITVARDNFESIRQDIMGFHQVQLLRDALTAV